MKRIVGIKIDVTKIDKARLFKGQKGQYLNATIYLDDDKDQYDNNGMITQDVSKEERESGVRGEILGNAAIRWVGEATPSQNTQQNTQQAEPVAEDDIPF